MNTAGEQDELTIVMFLCPWWQLTLKENFLLFKSIAVHEHTTTEHIPLGLLIPQQNPSLREGFMH